MQKIMGAKKKDNKPAGKPVKSRKKNVVLTGKPVILPTNAIIPTSMPKDVKTTMNIFIQDNRLNLFSFISHLFANIYIKAIISLAMLF